MNNCMGQARDVFNEVRRDIMDVLFKRMKLQLTTDETGMPTLAEGVTAEAADELNAITTITNRLLWHANGLIISGHDWHEKTVSINFEIEERIKQAEEKQIELENKLADVNAKLDIIIENMNKHD